MESASAGANSLRGGTAAFLKISADAATCLRSVTSGYRQGRRIPHGREPEC